MSLLALQRDMRDWLTCEDADAATRFGISAAPGLRVYQNNYRSQLVGCLEASFARTRSWIGDEAFLSAAATHIDRVPPSSWTLDAYARDFPATLGLLYAEDPEVAELAGIELALEEAFVGADAVPLTVSDLAEVVWDRAVLRLIPTLETLPSRTNAAALWSALAADEELPMAQILDEPQAVLVWAQEQKVHFRTIDRCELRALMQLRSGVSFSRLCDKMVVVYGEHKTATILGRWLGRWVFDGLISTIES